MDAKTIRSRLALLLACSLFQFAVSAAPPAAKKAFVSFKAPAETVTNYEIVEPVLLQYDNSKPWPKKLRVKIPSSNSNFTLQLQLNEGLIAPHFTSQHYDQAGSPIFDKGHANCFYHGQVEGHPNWTLVMSTCHGLRGSFGNLSDKEQYYHLEPLNPVDNSLEQPLAFYLSREYQHMEGTCGSKDHTHDVDAANYVHMDTIQKRLRRQSSDRRIVEWLMVNDNRQFLQYDGNLTRTVLRSLEIANFVDMVYRVLNIRVVLVHVTTWTNGDQIPGGVVSNSDALLDDFRDYVFNNLFLTPHDSAMLLTGIDLDGSTVGIAFIRTMCDDRSSVGLSQDNGGGVDFVGSTAAHELGHIFNMQHDSPPRDNCNCQDPSGGCIMAASSGVPAPTQWSQCSVTDLENGYSLYNLDRCLTNEPTMTVGDPVCGNGIRERDEVCDCGSLQECTDPCCNATSCMLVEGAQCQEGPCCQSNCQFTSYGTTCREATNECDIAEYCLGNSSDCPANVNKQDTTLCNDNQFYCFAGFCRTYDDPCRLAFGGGSGKGADGCFIEFNTDGDQFGNCGYNSVGFIACAPSDVFCGQLHCIPGEFQIVDLQVVLTITTVSTLSGESTCRSFTSQPGEDFMSPGLVQDGTQCGNGSLCFQQQCISISDPVLGIPPKPIGSNGEICSGNGQVNNLGQCSCIVGFTGATCDIEVSIVQESGGSNVGAIVGGVVGAILGILVIAGVVAIVVYFVKFRSSKSARVHLSSQRTAQSSEPTTKTNVAYSSSGPPSRPPPTYVPPPSDAKSRRPPPARPTPSRPTPSRPPPSRPPPSRPPPSSRLPPSKTAPPKPDPKSDKPAKKPPVTPRATSSKPSPSVATSKLQVQWPPPNT